MRAVPSARYNPRRFGSIPPRAKRLFNTDDAILLVMPADHLIAKVDEFYDAVAEGIPFALNGGVVCFGITPTRPDVGYGYIKQGKPVDKNVFHLDSFAEKPEAKVAQEYVDSGLYTWNSGIFMLKASTWLSAIEQLQPAIHSACTTSFEHAKVENDFNFCVEELENRKFQITFTKKGDGSSTDFSDRGCGGSGCSH